MGSASSSTGLVQEPELPRAHERMQRPHDVKMVGCLSLSVLGDLAVALFLRQGLSLDWLASEPPESHPSLHPQ